MFTYKQWQFVWFGLKGWEWFDSGFRFNGGGWTMGAKPYQYWRIGPMKIIKYL